jgi:hypothetical protein
MTAACLRSGLTSTALMVASCTRGSFRWRKITSEISCLRTSATRSDLLLIKVLDALCIPGQKARLWMLVDQLVDLLHDLSGLHPVTVDKRNAELCSLMQIMVRGFGDRDPKSLMTPINETLDDATLVLETARQGEMKLRSGNSNDHWLGPWALDELRREIPAGEVGRAPLEDPRDLFD